MQIRPLEARDVAAVAALLRTLALRYITHECTPDAQAAFLKEQDAHRLAERVAAGFVYHVAEDAGQIVGFVGMRERSHLYHLFVASHWQGRGLARQLWETARDEALRGGAPAAFTVNASNYAVPAYQALGFVRSAPAQCSAGLPFNPMRLALPEAQQTVTARHG